MRAKRKETAKTSSRVLLIFLAISLCIGIGVGYAIKDSKAGASDSDDPALMDQITDLNLTVEQLQAQTSSLSDELDEKKSQYLALLADYNTTSDELAVVHGDLTSLQEEHQNLMDQYEDLKADFGTYKVASDNATVEEVLDLQAQVSSLQDSVDTLQSDKFWLDVEIARLNKLLTPSPDHALVRPDVWTDETLWSKAWKMRDYELQLKLEELAQLYYATHKYIEGETDCNDMAVDLWNMLLKEDIKSAIVVGNRDMPGLTETLEESNHAWLYVFNAEGKVIYLEPTTGEVFYGKLPDGTANPKAVSYRDGFIYRQPSDLRKDLKGWW